MLGDDQTITVTGQDGKPVEVTGAQLSAMTHSDLSALRILNQKDSDLYAILAPFEHQAYAREFTSENPVLGAASLAVATPAYALAKLAGMAPKMGSGPQTQPSWDQVSAGFNGIGQGIAQAARRAGIVK